MFLIEMTLITDEKILFPIEKCAIVETKKGVQVIFEGKPYAVKESLNDIYMLMRGTDYENKINQMI